MSLYHSEWKTLLVATDAANAAPTVVTDGADAADWIDGYVSFNQTGSVTPWTAKIWVYGGPPGAKHWSQGGGTFTYPNSAQAINLGTAFERIYVQFTVLASGTVNVYARGSRG